MKVRIQIIFFFFFIFLFHFHLFQNHYKEITKPYEKKEHTFVDREVPHEQSFTFISFEGDMPQLDSSQMKITEVRNLNNIFFNLKINQNRTQKMLIMMLFVKMKWFKKFLKQR